MGDLDWVAPTRKSGAEALTFDGESTGLTLADVWGWSTSDLSDNLTRGALAEFVVAAALGIPVDGVRESWAAWDLTTPGGIEVEVKSAAYLQTWTQSRPSVITFRIPRTRAWDARTGRMETEPRRQADVYVFALLAHADKRTLNPLEAGQWRFYIVATSVLDAHARSQHSITLPSLRRLSPEVLFADLDASVADVFARACQGGRR